MGGVQQSRRMPAIGIWTGALDFVPAARLTELAAELESLGYGAVWVPEVAGRDVFVTLTLILAATDELLGGTGIASIWGRDAVTMACGARAVTEAFPGRLLLGLGVSHRNLVEDLRGHVYQRPLTAMSSYLDAMDAAPYTAERPATPVRRLLGALGPRMLGLARDKADGAHPYLVPVEHTAQARETLGDGPLLCPEQMFVLEADATSARTMARRALSVYLTQPNYVRNLRRLGFGEADITAGGSDRLVDALVVWGGVEAVLARAKEHLDAGADHVCLQALVDGKRVVPVEQWRALAPAVRELVRGPG